MILIEKNVIRKGTNYYSKMQCELCNNVYILRNTSLKNNCFKCSIVKHNKEPKKLWNTYNSMKKRCYNKNSKDYKNYGARGITICDEWLNDFTKFVKDMGLPEKESYSIDRKNNNKGYSLENCHWVDRKQQNINRRNVVMVHGYPLITWARAKGATTKKQTDSEYYYYKKYIIKYGL